MSRKPKDVVQKAIDYKQVFGSEHGKRVLLDLMGVHYMMGSTFVADSPTATAFREGERNVVLRILNLIETDIEQLKQRIKERYQE